MIKIILAVTNDVVTDNRVHKIASTLSGNGYEVTVVGRRFLSSQHILGRSYEIFRFRLWFNKTALFYANYNIRLFFYLLMKKCDIIVSNDLDTLLACKLASKIRKKVLVFDSHELFTEVPELVNRPVIRKIWYLLEKALLPHVRLGYTVSAPIQEYYKRKYNCDFELIRNVSSYCEGIIFKKFPKEIIIVYQGAVNVGRGLELMLAAMQHIDNAKLWVVGNGDILDKLKDLSVKLGVQEKVIFFGRVLIDNLPKYSTQAHIGISLEEDLGLNYRYALPNKLFDYIQSRIPVIVSDLPEMRAIVEKYKIGMVLKERYPEKLAQTINNIIEDSDFCNQLSQNLEHAARDLCWQNEEEKIIKLYKKASEQLQARNAL